MRAFLLLILTFFNPLIGEISKNQLLYLMQAGAIERAVELYQTWTIENGKHDFSILEEVGNILLRQSISSRDEEAILLSMYGMNIAGSLGGMELYEQGINSKNPLTQMAAIQFLNHLQEDEVEDLLFKGFSSPFLMIQMEAAYALAQRRSERATGMIESLMQKLPPYFHVYFPELFALIGTPDAIAILKHMTGHSQLAVRLFSILSAARFGRDDFLSEIRSGATHCDFAEQETCAAAVGLLKDSHSIDTLKKLATSKNVNVNLAACQSLAQLGNISYRESILEHAVHKNLFAISLLSDVPNSEPLLEDLLSDYNFHNCVNAALILLKKKNPKCLPVLLKMLIKDTKDLGFKPIYSPGHSMMAWKVIPSSTQYAENTKQDIPGITLALKEMILQDALELPEKDFLTIAQAIFAKKENTLIPTLIHLLERMATEGVINLLKEESNRFGAPFIRTYCHLALFRLQVKGPHRQHIYNYLKREKDHELFQFRKILSWTDRKETANSFFLTPEETSRLVIESYQALIEEYEMDGINILLTALREGHKKNRFLLAGLLLKAIQ